MSSSIWIYTIDTKTILNGFISCRSLYGLEDMFTIIIISIHVFDVKLFKFFLVFKFLNFLICLRQMIFFRTKHYKLLIWLGGVIFSFLLICIDFLFLFPEFKYLVYLFFDLLFMCMFIGYQILTLSKNNIYHFYIGFALYIIANLALNSFYSVF